MSLYKLIIIFHIKALSTHIYLYIYISSSNGNLNNYKLVCTCTIIIKVCIIYKHEHNLLIIYRSGGFHISSSIFSLSLLL